MPSLPRRQRGALMLVVVVVVMLAALTALISMTGELISSGGRRMSATESKLSTVQKALVAFVTTHQRLPCPANPAPTASNPGWPDDVSPLALPASTSCVYPGGVVPWSALGLSQEEATDEWGRLISYRVFDGTYGLVQDKGATAVNCDTDNSNTPNVEPTSTGLCSTAGGAHDTLRSHFITYVSFGSTPSFDKGLSVFDFGTDPSTANIPNVAFVLISHGPSGLGGYTQGGGQIAGITVSARDYSNTQAAPAFFIRQAPSSADIASGSSGHFDDFVSYLKISDLLLLADQDARDWPEIDEAPSISAVATANMTTASVDSSSPHFMSSTGTAANQFFTAVDAGTAIQAPLAAGSFSSCLWWPGKLTLVSGTTRRSLNLYLQFAATDNSGDPLTGFVQGFIAGTSAVSTTGAGSGGSATISVASATGISAGMTALGSGIATGAKVSSVSGTTVTLTTNNTGLVGGNIVFGAPTNVICGTSVDATVTATGAAGQRNLVVSSTTGVAVGQSAFGNGIPFNAIVSSIAGSGAGATVRLSQNLLKPVSGSVDFATSLLVRRDIGWAGGTLAAYANRFGVEFDAQQDPGTAGPPAVATANDPSRPHLAIDSTGVVHGTDAASCSLTGSAQACDSEASSLPSIIKSASGTSGSSSITITDTGGMYGIVHGMSVTGTGVPGSTTVTSISGNTVALSNTLTGSVSSITFGALSTTNLMQNGLNVFHGTRVEVSPRDCYAASATGTSGASSITVTDATLIQNGMAVYGPGVGAGAKVTSPFQINLSATNTADFSENVTFSDGNSDIVLGASGTSGQSSISVSSVEGVRAGMSVSGGAVGNGATVSSVSVSLSQANWQAIANNLVFAGGTGVSTFANGSTGAAAIAVTRATGISPGMSVLGTGLAASVTVSSISGTTVMLSSANTGTVHGAVKFYPQRTLVKGWTLTNAGCNAEPALCAAMVNTSSKFVYPGNSGASTTINGNGGQSTITVGSASGLVLGMSATGTGVSSGAYVTNITGTTLTLSIANSGSVSGIGRFDNRQILHSVSCVDAASAVNAYDSLYYGLATSSRTTGAAVSRTGSGIAGSNQLALTSTSGIGVGMAVRGAGIGDDATVSSIDSSTVLTLSVVNSADFSGTVSFAGGANLAYRALNTTLLSSP